MTLYKPDNCKDESQFIYYCDICGYSSNFSDYWWSGCCHWEELNFTICNECLRKLARQDEASSGAVNRDDIRQPRPYY
jgi:hypothetical protein